MSAASQHFPVFYLFSHFYLAMRNAIHSAKKVCNLIFRISCFSPPKEFSSLLPLKHARRTVVDVSSEKVTLPHRSCRHPWCLALSRCHRCSVHKMCTVEVHIPTCSKCSCFLTLLNVGPHVAYRPLPLPIRKIKSRTTLSAQVHII